MHYLSMVNNENTNIKIVQNHGNALVRVDTCNALRKEIGCSTLRKRYFANKLISACTRATAYTLIFQHM